MKGKHQWWLDVSLALYGCQTDKWMQCLDYSLGFGAECLFV